MSERRYREAETRLFHDAGLEPNETWLELSRVGVRTRVLEWGTGDPVVFLHGGPMAAATWAYVVAHLDGVRAILVDRPGCGLSEAPKRIPDPTSLPTYVEQLTEDVLDALGLNAGDLGRVLARWLLRAEVGGGAAGPGTRGLPGRLSTVRTRLDADLVLHDVADATARALAAAPAGDVGECTHGTAADGPNQGPGRRGYPDCDARLGTGLAAPHSHVA